jgi:hypothetical protein
MPEETEKQIMMEGKPKETPEIISELNLTDDVYFFRYW